MKKKYGGLGLVDPEVAKTNLLCKWIVKGVEPRESNLQLMLMYRLARFNPQRGRSWGGSALTSLQTNNTKVLQGQGYGATSAEHGKMMVKGTYQLPPRTRMELLHSNIWWSDGVELINKGFTYEKCCTLYSKGIQCVDNI